MEITNDLMSECKDIDGLEAYYSKRFPKGSTGTKAKSKIQAENRTRDNLSPNQKQVPEKENRHGL